MTIRDEMWIQPYQAPCGDMLLGACCGKLCLCNWVQERHPGRVMARLRAFYGVESRTGTTEITDEAARQLDDYFARRRTRFDLPLQFIGTDFQKSVWQALLDIPYGQTVSYKELAVAMGAPSAVRAVANANGANALSIIVPCHRVVGSDHSLTGYAGGIEAKRFLLEWEQNENFGAFRHVL